MIRFMADADFNEVIVRGCRRQGPAMDFLSAKDGGLEGVPDPGVLALAAVQDRVLVSRDLKTMPRHLGDFLQAHGFSPGLVIVPQHTPIRQAIDELVLISGAPVRPGSGRTGGALCPFRTPRIEARSDRPH